MQHSRFSRPVLLAAAVWSAAAFALRFWILKNSLDVNGILFADSPALIWTVVFSLVGFIGLTALCLRLSRLPGTEACFRGSEISVLPAALAAALLLAGCILRLTEAKASLDRAQRLTEIGGIVAAAGMAAAVIFREKLGKFAFWVRLPLALYACVSLILRFRVWSHDPMIIDIVPQLLALICAMLGCVMLTAFPLGAGHRRSTVLFSLMIFLFTVMSLPDYLVAVKTGLADPLIFFGLALWCATHACLLLRARVQDEPEPPAKPEAAEPEAPAKAEAVEAEAPTKPETAEPESNS